ncbi:hypothetical protein ANN_12848 [Periplaneta americana]|uniref:Uncharacterized protein n=1 Tax=Periplaneta americana TaxID=6978 RepID=A0ABQ8THW7_PERAM|nr:hypothetical protein ANN_12848 [Periplaneta americana]
MAGVCECGSESPGFLTAIRPPVKGAPGYGKSATFMLRTYAAFSPSDFKCETIQTDDMAYAKSVVYTTDISTPEKLHHRIVDAFQQTKNDPGLLETIRDTLRRKPDRWIQVHGQQFGHLI